MNPTPLPPTFSARFASGDDRLLARASGSPKRAGFEHAAGVDTRARVNRL